MIVVNKNFIMKSAKTFIFALLLTLLAGGTTSCEKTIDFESDVQPELCLSSVAVVGEPLEAYVSHSLPSDEAYNFEAFPNYNEQQRKYYLDQLAIKDATVKLTVNGDTTYDLTYNADTAYYVCTYVPKAGDRLVLTAQAQGYDPVQATTVVPEAVPVAQLQCETLYDQVDPDLRRQEAMAGFDIWGIDSIARITFRFTDPPEQQNYYRLLVRSVGRYYYFSTATANSVCDVFNSADPIFYDALITRSYHSWPVYFQNVFDDHLVDGRCSYPVTVESRLRRADLERYIRLELQSITPELYEYLKSIRHYEMGNRSDVYADPTVIYTNVEGGWGIFGALNARPVTIWLQR